MLVALEHLVICAQTPRYYRVFSCHAQVSDHRGILPSSVNIDATGFSAQVTRSKTLGDDRTVASRPLVIDRCCCLAVADWMLEGWRLLKEMADYPRDYLHGCRRRELSYDTASAMQNRVLRMVKSNDEFLFCPSATRFWTPHSNRTFMPSATATLGFEKSVRDFLGGWSAQASERYARIEAQRIRNMQRTVVAELQKDLVDPLAEAETLVQFDGFLAEQGVPEEERSRCVKLLERGVRTEVPRASGEPQHQAEEPELSSSPHLTEVAAPVLSQPQHKGRLGEAFACLFLGSLQKRPEPAALELGFHISCSGKKKVRSLLPGVDFMNYTFAGNTFTKKAEYDTVCRLCARVGVQDDGDSSATVSSSSSSGEA